MDLMTIIKTRRSIRKYQNKQIPSKDLEKIIEAGLYAPNAGGRQGSIIIGINNAKLTEQIGKLNIAKFDRTALLGSYVSDEQPSIIDDPNIKSGFYGAPSVCVIFGAENFLYSIPDAFCCAENMVLMANSIGIASCIVARAEETFDNPDGKKILSEWEIPESYIARCFVLLGYIEGNNPSAKKIHKGRFKIV
ncbi:MAG: nitroreductase family protein [Synergistaceae bacterium]|nr:nitroreductase family protein [Synergistaceae bacterium]MBQ7069588.1 nitroreductase family protein [Synergistaceae bacterium]MBR0076605.1 nitroreductase family protein [Synergistaceae bacterium]MBR0079363.1 nitroreductase family protein [Synergistaceae bacterium]MBR0233102.1 nitroreductase family protein [Synergistaceae bacterium]